MKVVLGLDDFSVVNSRLDILLKLKEMYPDFKVSLFTVPRDIKTDWGRYIIRKQLLEEIKKHLDWIQIIPHGLTHSSSSEFKGVSYRSFRYEIIPEIKKAFGYDNLPFVYGFKAPHWKWNQNIVNVLDDEGWWGAVDERQDRYMNKTHRFYEYSHCLDQNFPIDADVLKLHGHIYGTNNDIGLCFNNLTRLPKDVEWCYADDFIELNYD